MISFYIQFIGSCSYRHDDDDDDDDTLRTNTNERVAIIFWLYKLNDPIHRNASTKNEREKLSAMPWVPTTPRLIHYLD